MHIFALNSYAEDSRGRVYQIKRIMLFGYIIQNIEHQHKIFWPCEDANNLLRPIPKKIYYGNTIKLKFANVSVQPNKYVKPNKVLQFLNRLRNSLQAELNWRRD